MNKKSKATKANTSAKSSSKHTGGAKATKAPAKRSTKQKAKWKIIGDKVELSPGDYTIADLKAILKRIQAGK